MDWPLGATEVQKIYKRQKVDGTKTLLLLSAVAYLPRLAGIDSVQGTEYDIKTGLL
jgi:hypothetical protein